MLKFRPLIEDNSRVDSLGPVVENPRGFWEDHSMCRLLLINFFVLLFLAGPAKAAGQYTELAQLQGSTPYTWRALRLCPSISLGVLMLSKDASNIPPNSVKRDVETFQQTE